MDQQLSPDCALYIARPSGHKKGLAGVKKEKYLKRRSIATPTIRRNGAI